MGERSDEAREPAIVADLAAALIAPHTDHDLLGPVVPFFPRILGSHPRRLPDHEAADAGQGDGVVVAGRFELPRSVRHLIADRYDPGLGKSENGRAEDRNRLMIDAFLPLFLAPVRGRRRSVAPIPRP
jgi:hypothetical protein